MKLKSKKQDFQEKPVNAVADLFKRQGKKQIRHLMLVIRKDKGIEIELL